MPRRRNKLLNIMRFGAAIFLAAIFAVGRRIPRPDQKLDVSPATISGLTELRGRTKYVEVFGTIYNGMRPEAARLQAEEQLNRLLDRLLDQLPSNPSKKFAMKQFAETLDQFDAIDTEDREQLLRYLKEIMDLLGIADSGGLLARWMYGPLGDVFLLLDRNVRREDARITPPG
ncbi:DUF4844 domain-containing protein [Bradyrhizobium lablabi]|uniref:DUF4844 domain-containing protein n=1 Tax=Bradyrhizobium lablabi TaxID=722472 RepID=UPI001BAAD8CF|nr:DUF4844 domain-containing protein [Bradyrhizobium lablabi]MBR1124651.1 DUF4844 domain-containing protein [Bradyrhizobium lablabi]